MNMPSTKTASRPQPLPVEEIVSRRQSRHHWWVWILFLGLVAYGGYRVLQRARKQPVTAAAPPARAAQRSVPVEVAAARRGDMPVYLRGLGSAAAFNTVTVKSRVDGQLVNVAFQEGQFVQKGDLLAEIDPRPFQVQLEQAQGQMARDQAQLSDAQANLRRYQALFDAKVIPRQQLDTQAASVGQFEGAIQADQAQIDNAKLLLTYCRITAPISGRIGLRIVDQGNIVHASDANGLVTIAQIQPIAVLFNIPQDNLPPILRRLRAGSRLPVEAWDRDFSKRVAAGYLLTVDNQIDQSTGTSRLKAVFDNRDNALFPNQFVNVQLLLETRKGSVIIPAVAVQRGPRGNFVYVVGSDKKAAMRPITIGITQGNDVSIEQGVAPGELVVVDGADKLQDGSRVEMRTPGNGRPRRGSRT